MATSMEKITALAKRRGFVYPSSEIYGGLANAYDYGPLGVELLRNIERCWWERFVLSRPDIIGLETGILMNPKVWEASGHTQSFEDVLIDCKKCKLRMRADHLLEQHLKGEPVEGLPPKTLGRLIQENKIPCPECGAFQWTDPRRFNLLFETQIGILPEKHSLAYLRGEIAQGMFVNFRNVLASYRVLNPDLETNLPFGLAQSGKAFRNEITKGNFIFRTLEFNLAEIEYFFNPATHDWKELYQAWKQEMERWAIDLLGLSRKNLSWRVHTDKERAHYSAHTEDLDYNFPFGKKELYGLAYRTDFDLKNHQAKSGQDLSFKDPATGRKVIPHVIEPTFGLDRTLLALLTEAYIQEKERVVLRLKPSLAPFKVAVFPLLANKPKLVKKAREVFNLLSPHLPTAWDARGNIGKRYYAQDEAGTPFGVTIDFETLEKDDVTVRERDTMKQERVKIEKLVDSLREKLG